LEIRNSWHSVFQHPLTSQFETPNKGRFSEDLENSLQKRQAHLILVLETHDPAAEI
jgi:hypothetical protein